MAELDIKQANFVSRAVEITPRVLEVLQDLDSLWAEWSALGYAIGQVNAIADDDLTGANQHMTAVALNDLLFAYGTMVTNTNAASRATMYRALP